MNAEMGDRISRMLGGLGRQVSGDTLTAELDGLEGLPSEQAEEIVLASYGVAPDGRAGPGFEPDCSSSQGVRRLLGQVSPAMWFVAVAAAAGLVPALAVPLLTKIFVDRYLVADDESGVTLLFVGLIGSVVVAGTVVALQFAVLRRVVLRMGKTGQSRLAWQLLHLRPPDLAEFGIGDLVGRSGTQRRLASQAGMQLPLAGVNIVNTIVFALVLLALNLAMGVAALVVAVLAGLIAEGLMRMRGTSFGVVDREMLAMSEIAAETVNSIESIKAAAWEQHAFKRWMHQQTATGRALQRLGVLKQWVAFIWVMSLAFGQAAVLGVGAYEVFNGQVLLGTVVAAQAFAVLLHGSISKVIILRVVFRSVASANRQLMDVWQTPLDPEVMDIESAEPVRFTGAVELRGVTFGYDRSGPPLLESLDLSIPAGHRLALVGGSGSGKTTIARLVVGELRPWSGFVALDGRPRLAVPRRIRTGTVAYVPQQSALFPGTLRDNLTMWDQSITDEQVRAAARDACIEEAVLSRAGGYDALVNGGDAGFSGGEMQRLAIARALTGNPTLLVLDEATSALDPVVEAEVEGNLRGRGCTCLVVAHRLSTVRDADEIAVVQGGRIVQRGKFDDLRRGGAFAELIHV